MIETDEQATNPRGGAAANAMPTTNTTFAHGLAGVRPFLRLGRALIPAGAILLVAAVVWVVFVGTPIWKARSAPQIELSAIKPFMLTPVELKRLKETDVYTNGVWVEDLRPWQIAKSGIGGVSYGAKQKSLFNAALGKLMQQPAKDDRAAVAGQLDGLGSGDRAAVTYLAALQLYRAGQWKLALTRTEATLKQIRAARGGKLTDLSKMRLDGQEIAVKYLQGYILKALNKPQDSEKAFADAAQKAGEATGYKAYSSTPSLLFQLDPRFHLVDLSTGTLINDYVRALHARDPEAAWTYALTTAKLFDDPEGVRTSRHLAATLQMMAVAHGRDDLVERLDAGPSPDTAGQVRAAARLVAGLSSDLGPLSSTPDAEKLRPWSQIVERRPSLASALAPAVEDVGDPMSGGIDPQDQRFLATWKSQYLSQLGHIIIARGVKENPAYLTALLRSGRFDARTEFAAATRAGGLNPWLVVGLLALLGLAFLASLLLFVVYLVSFYPLHYASRRRRALRGDTMFGR